MPQAADPVLLTPDLCVLGGGTAGHAIALAAAALGLSCVVVDKLAKLGAGQAGDLARSMLVAATAADPHPDDPDPGRDRAAAFAALRERTARAVGAAAPNFSAERLRALGATVLQAHARFLDRRTVAAGRTTIRARRFVIATGARATIPRLQGMDLIRPLTIDTLGALAAWPSRLAIVGRTPAALECAQAFRRLGSEVTLVGPGEPDASIDPELMAVVETALRRAGVVLHDRAVARLEPRGAGVEIMLDGDPATGIVANHLLVATGTTPMIEDLGLDRAGVRRRDGVPVVGRDLRTSNRRIFAIGDVLGPASPGPAAIPPQVGLVLRAAFLHRSTRYVPDEVPRLVRTSPGLAACGLSEAAARKRGGPLRILRWSFADNDRAVATGRSSGQVKVIATSRGQVLGAGIVGPQAEELIVPWVMAIRHRIPLDAMASLPIGPESLSDASRRAAVSFVAGRLRSPWVKRALRILKLFG